jgi:hypothetical protein
VEVQITTSPALERLLGQPPALVKRAGSLAAKRAAEEYVDAIHDWIHAGHAFTPRTGRLEQETGWHPEGDGAYVYSQAPHAPYVEFGTGLWGPKRQKYSIQPKPGRKALRWFPGGGGVAFARSVMHPGIAPMPFFFADQATRQARLLAVAREAVAEVLNA